MSENTAQKDIDLSKMVYPLIVDGPVCLTVEGATQELIVKAFMPIAGSTDPIQTHIRFTNEAFGQLAGGILKLIELGHVTVSPSDPKSVQ